MLRYTRIFDDPMAEGWNKGYLYFDNFRRGRFHDSFSVHYSKLELRTSNNKLCEQFSATVAFDESAIPFLALLERGVQPQEIMHQYDIRVSASLANLSRSDWLTIASMILTALTFVAGRVL